MNETTKHTQWIKKLLSFLLQIILAVTIFLSLSYFQERKMVQVGESISKTEIKLINIGGTITHLKLDNEKRDTFIYFFAPWCNVCHASIGNLEEIYQDKFNEMDFVIIALDWRSIEEIDEFLSHHDLTIPVLLGTNEIRNDFKITAFPSYYIVSKEAKILAKNIGYTTELGMRLRVLLGR